MSEFGDTSYTLLHRACNLHDEQAWEALVEHYRRFIFYILHEMGVNDSDIDDVAQQVLVSLTKDICCYDQSRARFRTWLSTVIRNAALMHFRKQKTRQGYIRLFGEERSWESLEQPSEIDRRIQQDWAAYVSGMAMDRVKEVFKGQAIEVFEWSLDGLSATEIAEKTGLSVSSVYTLRKRVKKRLYLEIRGLVAELEPA